MEQVDFTLLEEKVSPEGVIAVKEVIKDIERRNDQILKVRIEEVHIEFPRINSLKLYILAQDDCHYFSFNLDRNYFIHDKMHRIVIREFSEMDQERIEELVKREGLKDENSR